MLAPFQFKRLEDKILITNDFGEYEYLTKEDFKDLINNNISSDHVLYESLEAKGFLYSTSVEAYLDKFKHNLRAGKSFVFSSTSLHIFVVTNYCNGQCVYCQAQSSVEKCNDRMSEEIAKKAVDLALQSPQQTLDFEFQGGEPLSNFDIIKFIVEYAEQKRGKKNINYSIVTNLTMLTDDKLKYIIDNNISISVSIDGPKDLHNQNRPLAGGVQSYDKVFKNIRKLKDCNYQFGAIQTTTRYSLAYSKEIIDEYVNNQLHNVFIRPLTSLGVASDQWNEIGYTPEEFVEFYKKCIDYILELNINGYYLVEGHAAILLSKILNGIGTNYMELRSPCGAAIGQIAYYHDGNVFTCDEGRMLYEMGDDSFCLGSLFDDDYNSLMDSKLCKTVCRYSIVESLPGCCDCVYQPYCGTCPVINYALEKDAVSRKRFNDRCQIFQGMLDYIFIKLQNSKYEEVFYSWVK
ncbi:His-Xaa-Ser system radical SAM maturase HxsB [Lachnospiraceae bacterium]|nr:His-Xaa-Ser system radical SAM maturase HxsB [Lachnospiraceae bacterium]